MDLNYDIHTWDFSLRTATLMKITQNVVEGSLRNPQTSDSDIIVLRARERAENLDLLPDMITEIKKLIPHIVKVLLKWNYRNRYGISPILTPHGTVDVAKSARAFIGNNDQDLPASSKFDMACDYCLEEDIFHFGKLLSKADKLIYKEKDKHFWTMQGFWYNIYKGNFSRMLTLNDLSSANLADGINRAIYKDFNLAIKYFLKKAPREIVQHIKTTTNYIMYFHHLLSLGTFVTLLQIYQGNSLESVLSSLVLKRLLIWPYQRLFLKAAKTFVLKISLKEFWDVADNIIDKAVYYFEDYNYKGLFIGFWKMRKDYARTYFDRQCVNSLLHKVFRKRDKHIAFMVLDDISEYNKEEFLPYFKSIFVNLIYMKDYKTLLFIMDVCKVKVEPLTLRIKSFVEEYCSGNITLDPISQEDLHSMVSWKGFKNCLHTFKKIMSECESSEEPEK